MKTYAFTLVLSGIAELTPDLADILYEATKGELELEWRDGTAFLEVTRKATSLADAISVAIREVEAAAAGAKVIRVESEVARVIAAINADLVAAANR